MSTQNRGPEGREGQPGREGAPGREGVPGIHGDDGAKGVVGARGPRGSALPKSIVRAFLLMVVLFFVILVGLVYVVLQGKTLGHENANRINDIQTSRLESCRNSYEGIRQVFRPFFAPPPRTKKQQTDLDKFNRTIDNLKRGCKNQVQPPKVINQKKEK